MILVQKGLIYNPVKKLALDIEMHTQLWLATLVIGVATFFFFFFFFESGLKLDEKSIENGLEGQKCSVGGLFWGWLPPP